MNLLIVGSGGREHALGAAVAKSPLVKTILFAPGNAGTAALGRNLLVDPADAAALIAAARTHQVDLTVVGPEGPLCAGIVDRFAAAGLKIFGPSSAAARLEGDKAFAKQLMRRAAIPTADARIFNSYDQARTYVASRDSAVVVKAAGLAQGKGVFVCDDPADGLRALEKIMVDRVFGVAGATVVVEEKLTGTEASVHAIIDGRDIYLLESARDYKRLGDGDSGPNTGGMGACSPNLALDAPTLQAIVERVLVPVVDTLNRDRTPYVGVLYVGVMLTAGGPKVLEFNCRFGDPEAQVLLPRLRSDLVEVMLATLDARLAQTTLEWDPRPAVCVVLAAKGYPGECARGKPIAGLQKLSGDVHLFHAGTARRGAQVVTSGGRVLGLTALGTNQAEARSRAYAAVECIDYLGLYFRRDIGAPD